LGAAYGGIAATPLRAGTLERLALGKPWRSEATLRLLLDAVRGIGTPLSDQRGSAAYRGAMVEKLLERFHAETNTQANLEAAE
jgi:xanthine dehydrogenase small subunit